MFLLYFTDDLINYGYDNLIFDPRRLSMQGLISAGNISFLLVFLEGLLSFFSPCVIPLIPIYISYLAGNAKQVGEDGIITYQRKKVFFHTLFFVLGISFAFFILGMSFTALGSFFKSNQLIFTRLGGILIIVLGLYQVGIFEFKFLQRERKINFRLKDNKMNPLIAFIMGFTFSFAWTPCVGPALSSVLILASGTGSSLTGNLLVLIYTLGFVIPFLFLGLFTTQVLNFLKSHRKFLRYTVKAGGILLIIIGIMTFTGWMNGVTKYLSKFSPPSISQDEETNKQEEEINKKNDDSSQNPSEQGNSESSEDQYETSDNEIIKEENDNNTSTENNDNPSKEEAKEKVSPAIDFTLTDQYGKEHTLSEYKGKVVFLNFWATWCPPCKMEMPDIEELYNEYNQNQDDIIILGVANPSSPDYPNNADESKEEIIAFLEENGYTFPTVFDETGELFQSYYISAFPTTFLIDKEGNFYGYATGMLTKSQMINAIQQANEATE